MIYWADLVLVLVNQSQETKDSCQLDMGTVAERFCKKSQGQGGCDGKEKLKYGGLGELGSEPEKE